MNFTQIIKDFKESNRWKHFLFAIPSGFILTILFVLGLAIGMEFKDKQYSDYWDWKDWQWIIYGGLVGQFFQILLLFILF